MTFFNFNRYWNKLATEEMKKYDLKGAYALYFVTIYNYDGDMTIMRLSEMCGKDKADISRAVANMEQRGLLVRVGSNSYRAKLELTPEGEKIAGDISKRAAALVNQAGQGITEEERSDFYHALEIISANLKKMIEEL